MVSAETAPVGPVFVEAGAIFAAVTEAEVEEGTVAVGEGRGQIPAL